MARKKVILFIVEGINDQTCLGGVLEGIISSNEVRFEMTNGDITTRTGIDCSKISAEIGNIVNNFRRKYHLEVSHFFEVVHLVDMDGAYIIDEDIEFAEVENYTYSDENIFTKDVEGTKRRNKQKREVLEKMLSINKVVKSIPYSVYYFSCNMDHVFHNDRNLGDKEKSRLATEFEKKYADNIDAFIELMKNSQFTVHGDYQDTWNFIKVSRNSLNRHSNFYSYLEKVLNGN